MNATSRSSLRPARSPLLPRFLPRRLARSTLVLGALALGGCAGTRTLSDPIVELRSPQGSELGVSTDYGVVFLGLSARSGEVEITAWFGDGPSVETAVVEPLGGGLYTAEAEIRLPKVPLTFDSPRAGETVVLIGRRGKETWEEEVTVQEDRRASGLLLSWTDRLDGANDQRGAGVFLVSEKNQEKQLIGLVSGRLDLVGTDGKSVRYLTAVGPEELWRLVTFKRDYTKKRKWVYREDIL